MLRESFGIETVGTQPAAAARLVVPRPATARDRQRGGSPPAVAERTSIAGAPASWSIRSLTAGASDAASRPARVEDGLRLPARWLPIRPVGQGGQAEVWLAEDREMGELVAIKVFDRGVSRQSPERVRREATLGRSLAHPALVRVFEVIEADGRLALVMEWVAGDSLAERARLGLLPVAEVIRIGEETLAALAYLHSRGVLHRDVKPGNLLLDGSGRVRLADLGLALQLDGPPPPSGSSAGTLSYMSPEQICGHRLTPAADLYALGVTMYQLLTGELPYSGDEETVARGHLSARVPDPSRLRADCPRWLARFVIRLLAKNPEERWPDAEAAAADLHRHTAVDLPRFWRRIASAAAGSALLLAALAASYTTIAPAGGDGGAAMELAELE